MKFSFFLLSLRSIQNISKFIKVSWYIRFRQKRRADLIVPRCYYEGWTVVLQNFQMLSSHLMPFGLQDHTSWIACTGFQWFNMKWNTCPFIQFKLGLLLAGRLRYVSNHYSQVFTVIEFSRLRATLVRYCVSCHIVQTFSTTIFLVFFRSFQILANRFDTPKFNASQQTDSHPTLTVRMMSTCSIYFHHYFCNILQVLAVCLLFKIRRSLGKVETFYSFPLLQLHGRLNQGNRTGDGVCTQGEQPRKARGLEGISVQSITGELTWHCSQMSFLIHVARASTLLKQYGTRTCPKNLLFFSSLERDLGEILTKSSRNQKQ